MPTSRRVAAAAETLDARLRRLGNRERAVQEKRYLKSALTHLGASVPDIRKVVRKFLQELPGLDREDLVALAEVLWSRGVHEHRLCAALLLEARVASLQAQDIVALERLLREARTWALVDNLAIHSVGTLVERFPELRETLDRWAVDADFWIRRSALLALLIPLREGRGEFDRFARYADNMLGEKEFFIRKAIGWVLRETSKRRPELVFGWLLPRAGRTSGLTVREAIRHLPMDLRTAIREARAGGS